MVQLAFLYFWLFAPYIIIWIIIILLIAFCQFKLARKLWTPHSWMAFIILFAGLSLPIAANSFLKIPLDRFVWAPEMILIIILWFAPIFLSFYLLPIIAGKKKLVGLIYSITPLILSLIWSFWIIVINNEVVDHYTIFQNILVSLKPLLLICFLISIYFWFLILQRRNRNWWMIVVLILFFPIYLPILTFRDVQLKK
ncbi:MAG: hypothetical protein ACD_3C00005G0001 [uncultured bacterium (gcode 4)]|uniref:Uncharacterized protein n=1 Tax=uncultured bacterium (gcode 4) TaxID=1234023 RepID=K2GZA6_9BACT|nr:MAG: hypothetical protein ACD_3C00005G0001 [uncultured bacterium (gcode 4)]